MIQLYKGVALERAEFQKILNHRGHAPLSPFYPLARFGVARAALLNGDATKAHQAYGDFRAWWQEAGTNLPAWLEAKKQFEKSR